MRSGGVWDYYGDVGAFQKSLQLQFQFLLRRIYAELQYKLPEDFEFSVRTDHDCCLPSLSPECFYKLVIQIIIIRCFDTE